MSQLFRKEAMDARRGEWLGAIEVATPLPRWSLAVLAMGIATAIVVFMIVGHYTQRERVSGQLVPSAGLLNVTAATAGIVTRVDVRQGQTVQRGDPLIEISSDTDSTSLGDTGAQVSQHLRAQGASLESDLKTQQASAAQQRSHLRAQLALLASQRQQVEAQMALQHEQVKSAQALLRRIKPLEEKGYVSAFRIEQQTNAFLQAQTQLKTLARQRLEIAQQYSEAKQKLAQLPLTLQRQQSSTKQKLDSVSQQLAQNEARRAVVLRAQRSGTVSSLLVDAGQSVNVRQPLLSLRPQGSKLQAQLLVPSRAVGFIDPGSRVVLRYQAYPYQKFGQHYGRVDDISRSALNPADVIALTGNQSRQPLYRVTVNLDQQAISAYGKSQPLKTGMALNADILMDRRSLIEWAFEPIYGLRRGLITGGKSHG
jgi:membrane fusion protein